MSRDEKNRFGKGKERARRKRKRTASSSSHGSSSDERRTKKPTAMVRPSPPRDLVSMTTLNLESLVGVICLVAYFSGDTF